MISTKRRFLAGGAILLALTLLATTGIAQTGDDPRNRSEDFYDAIDGALCMSHHEQEGFLPMLVSLAARYPQLIVNEPQNLLVNIRNPWKHTVHDIQVTINTTEAPNVLIIAGDLPPNTANVGLEATLSDANSEDAPFQEPFDVIQNATTVYAYARVKEAPAGSALGEQLQQQTTIGLSIDGPGEAASPAIGKGSPQSKVARVDGEDIAKHEFGTWNVNLWYDGGLDDEIIVEYGISVWYNRTATTEYTFFAGSSVVLRQDESASIEIPVMITSTDEARLDFRAGVRTFWAHQPGSNAVDNGHFFRFTSMNTKGGDQLLTVADTSAPQIVGLQVDLLNLFTRIIGFVSAFLVPIAMVTGGMFGKGTRRVMNKWIGGARKRVLWHSAMSWIIIAIASLHFVLALLEARFEWTKGLLWGGVGWVLLLSLGVTGYWQVNMIKRWNYKTWKNVHLWSAVGVFVFAGLHTVIDGSDLQVVRDLWPFLTKLAWPS